MCAPSLRSAGLTCCLARAAGDGGKTDRPAAAPDIRHGDADRLAEYMQVVVWFPLIYFIVWCSVFFFILCFWKSQTNTGQPGSIGGRERFEAQALSGTPPAAGADIAIEKGALAKLVLRA